MVPGTDQHSTKPNFLISNKVISHKTVNKMKLMMLCLWFIRIQWLCSAERRTGGHNAWWWRSSLSLVHRSPGSCTGAPSSQDFLPITTYNKDIRQGRIFLLTTYNNIKHGRMPFLNIQHLKKKTKDISNIRHDRISCQHYTRNISGMAVIKYIWHCWISKTSGMAEVPTTLVSKISDTTGFPSYNLQQMYQRYP